MEGAESLAEQAAQEILLIASTVRVSRWKLPGFTVPTGKHHGYFDGQSKEHIVRY